LRIIEVGRHCAEIKKEQQRKIRECARQHHSSLPFGTDTHTSAFRHTSNNGAFHGMAQKVLGCLLHLGENHGAELFGLEALVVAHELHFYDGSSAVIDDFERPQFHVAGYIFVVERATNWATYVQQHSTGVSILHTQHKRKRQAYPRKQNEHGKNQHKNSASARTQPLGVENRVFRVHGGLVLGRFADQTLCLVECNICNTRSRPHVVRTQTYACCMQAHLQLGVVRLPWLLAMISTLPSRITATHEYVVPKSIPTQRFPTAPFSSRSPPFSFLADMDYR
jgi:hypothetical protein